MFSRLAAVLLALAAMAPARADLIEIRDGSSLRGKMVKIEDGVIAFETTYAGVIKINQAMVTGFITDAPVNLTLGNGISLLGRVERQGDCLRIREAGGSFPTSVGEIVSLQSSGMGGTGATSAQPVLPGNWTYEITADVVGKSGNSNAFGTTAGACATRTTPRNLLKVYGAGAYSKQDGAVSANSTKAGADYSATLTDALSWYVRTETGRDEIKDLKFYDTTAVGFGHDLIKNKRQTLTERLGLAYRFETYGTNTRSLSVPALDAGLINTYAFKTVKMFNTLSFVPSLGNFSDNRLIQDSCFEFRLRDSDLWKVRTGVNNDYAGRPADHKVRLDTTYYTRLVLLWR